MVYRCCCCAISAKLFDTKMATYRDSTMLFFTVIVAFSGVLAADQTTVHNFIAQPFGQVVTEVAEMESFKCTFTYKCVGGTGEGWEMIIEKKDSEYHCVIERPEQSSYLFFMMFEASVEGGKLIRAEPYDNSKRMLSEDEFKVSGNKVKSQSSFKSNLATLALIVERK